MFALDTRTIILSYVISNVICAGVMAVLWRQNRQRFDGLSFWLADYVLQLVALILIALRGVIPDWVSVVVSNSLALTGTILLYMGLERFVGKRGPQIQNAILLVAFIAAQTYFGLVQPNLTARNINVALSLIMMCSQCAWLLLRLVDADMRPITRSAGVVFAGYVAINLVRVVTDLMVLPGSDLFHMDTYDTLFILLYQLLFVILTFTLFLMVNRRLVAELERDISERLWAEAALHESEKRYQEFIRYSIEGIYLTAFDQPIDTTLPIETQIDLIYANAYMADCNNALARMYNLPSAQALIGTRLIDAHGGKDNPVNRAAFRRLIETGYRSVNDETVEYDANGQSIWFLSNTIGIIENDRLTRLWGTALNITDHKQAEEALKLSEEKFYKAFHASPDAILITRASDGQIVEVNEGFGRITEYSREEALANSTLALGLWVNPQDRDTCVADLRYNHGVHDREYDFRAKSGRIINGLYSGEIIQLGQEAYLLSIVRDITARKRAEEALRESEGAFRGYFNMGTIGICVTSPQKGWIEVNDRLCAMLGYSREELMRLTWAEMTHPDDLDADLALFNQVLAGERDTYELEKRFMGKDGNVVQTILAVACQRNLDGTVQHLLASLIDITERKRVEDVIHLRLRLFEFAAAHAVSELMQQALDEIGAITNSPIGFFHFVATDQKTLLLQAWSTRTRNEFCRAEGEGLHYNIDEAGVWVDCVHQRRPVIHNDYAALPHRKGLPAGHAPVVRELVVPVLREGRVVSILGVGNKPSEYNEQDIELVAYIADIVWTIVEHKRLEDDVRQAKEAAEATNVQLAATVRELQSRNEDLDAFSHTVAHDIRSPVGQMVGVAEMLAELDTELSPEVREKSLGMLMRAGEKLTNIIDELLLLAGLRHVDIQPVPLDMRAIVNEALARLQHVLEQAGAEVTIADSESWPAVFGYPAWVEEVWVNYISNACKYGRVDSQAPRIVLGADPIGFENAAGTGVVRFWTRDFGMGITPDDQPRLFTPFTRLDQVRARGHGLGLSIVRRIVEKLGGEVGVKSDGVPGHGSEFSFTLPTARVE